MALNPSTSLSYTAGSVTSLSAGTGKMVASLDGISTEALFEVKNAAITSLEISPVIYQTSKDSSKAFLATAFFDDGSIIDVTDDATWSTSDSNISEVNYIGIKGLVYFSNDGTTVVSADYLGLTSSTSVDISLPDPVAISLDIDGTNIPMESLFSFEFLLITVVVTSEMSAKTVFSRHLQTQL